MFGECKGFIIPTGCVVNCYSFNRYTAGYYFWCYLPVYIEQIYGSFPYIYICLLYTGIIIIIMMKEFC